MKGFLKIAQRAACGLWLLVFTGWLAAGCASTKQNQDAQPAAPSSLAKESSPVISDEPFVVGDLVVVRFSVDVPQHEERIKEDGSIVLPLIGAVKAAGKTARELEKEICDRYATESYRPISITVTVTGIRGRIWKR